MSPWDRLRGELDAWAEGGRVATLWWRDDDATRQSPALERVLGISARCGVPLALAVIPRDIDGSLGEALDGRTGIATLQHGWGHDNHAAEGNRQEEYGPDRPHEVMVAELAEGWRRIQSLPGALPVLVAPWNRMDRGLLPHLPDAHLSAVSTLGPRPASQPAAGVRQTNVHVDIMDWNGGGFIGDEKAIDQVVRHLEDRRRGEVDVDEPTGLMTHHLYHDEGCWQFIAEFLAETDRHPAATWLPAQAAFWP